MDEKLRQLEIGSLLSELPSIIKRAGMGNDINSGSNFLIDNNIFKENIKSILEIIDCHDKKTINECPVDDASLSYILYEANNIASGAEKAEDNVQNYEVPLNSIFNRIRLDINHEEKFFSLPKNNISNMPKYEKVKLKRSDYADILEKNIKPAIKFLSEDMSPEKLLTAIEENCKYIPSSAYVNYPDISFYDHIKIVTALSSCMYIYDVKNNISDLRSEYYSSNDSRKKEKFLFVSGEFTGIQNFIYTITSKMAMKSLRGRSFYLELFIEHIIDEILGAVGLNRINLIYSGGSQFYMILPNVSYVKKILRDYSVSVNQFLLEELGTAIYFQLSYTNTTADELGNGIENREKNENKIGDIFKRLSIQSSKGKIRRYEEYQLEELFDEDSELNAVKSYTKECKICKNTDKLSEYNDELICNSCKNYIDLGRDISKLYHHNKGNYILEQECDKNDSTLKFPIYPDGYVSIKIDDEKFYQKNKDRLYRYYSVNTYKIREKNCKNIWIGNYNAGEEKSEGLIEFESLVKRSKGIERLAVLRADVDNLGVLFQRGFEDRGDRKSPYKYLTVSKSAVLSRYLSNFFKRDINIILQRNNELFNGYCNIIDKDNQSPRNIVIVYSGGDDVFVIGTWNDVIEFSVDLRTAFNEFTNKKVTLSAGIGMFSHSYPVYQMAKQTGQLEEISKTSIKTKEGNPTKDSVTLFGDMKNDSINHCYRWDEFINEVLGEKYQFLKEKTVINENEDKEKVFIGKSKYYDLMNLINSRLAKDDRIDIARFAYTIARIKHTDRNRDNYDEIKSRFLKWMKDKKDAKQLLTAIMILIYEERGEKNE